jgi:hypothetical protein
MKINKLDTLSSSLHKKEKSLDLSMVNNKKETTKIIHAERTLASAKIEAKLKRNKAAME